MLQKYKQFHTTRTLRSVKMRFPTVLFQKMFLLLVVEESKLVGKRLNAEG